MTKQALDLLFKENTEDQNKNQSYKDNFQEFELPDKYFLLEMYSKQKELQQFLADRGKTANFPKCINTVLQKDVQLAIYHLFCMQIEFQELKVELEETTKADDKDVHLPEENISARYELIDMFFFMFNVGIYTGLDINAVVDQYESYTKSYEAEKELGYSDLDLAVTNLMNYIDKLPWKAWKEYDLSKFNFSDPNIIEYYSKAVYHCIEFARKTFNETDKSLFDLYMNKWHENRRRQLDANSGYVLNNKDTETEQ